MKSIPMYSADLVTELQKIYPDKYQTEPTSVEEYWKLAGKIELIRMLALRTDNKVKDVKA